MASLIRGFLKKKKGGVGWGDDGDLTQRKSRKVATRGQGGRSLGRGW